MTDADANNGLSGSPILNADGEVVGIFGLGWPDSDAFSDKKMAIGVSYDFFRK